MAKMPMIISNSRARRMLYSRDLLKNAPPFLDWQIDQIRSEPQLLTFQKSSQAIAQLNNPSMTFRTHYIHTLGLNAYLCGKFYPPLEIRYLMP
jgi:hypothetical protein